MKRKLLCAVLLGLVFLTGCKKDSSDIDTVSSVKTDDAVLISVLEKYPEVDFQTEDEIEALYVSDCATEWKEDFDTSDYESYEENLEEFCEKMDELLDEEEDAGRIDDYEKSDSCYVIEFESGERMMYTVPSPQDFLAGSGDGINTIVTVWPCWGDSAARQANGAKDAAGYVDDKYEINDIVSYQYERKVNLETLLEPWLNFEKNDLIIVEGHGADSPTDNTLICIGERVTQESYADYFLKSGLSKKEFYDCFITSNERVSWGKINYDIFVSSAFFETFYEPGDLEGTVFYFGTCYSLQDDKLASTLCSLGAEVVIGWDDRAFTHYEREVCQNVFELLAEGKNITEAVDTTRDELYHKYNETAYIAGRYLNNAWGEPCCYPAGSTFTLDELYESEKVTEPEVEQPAVKEPETLSPEDLANIDYSQMQERIIGDVTLLYTDSYNESASKGKIPYYGDYVWYLGTYFGGYVSEHTEDPALYGSYPEFEIDGVTAPFIHFDGTYEEDIKEESRFLYDNANQTVYDEFWGWQYWGLLPNMPEEFRQPLEEIMNAVIDEYCIEKEEVIGLALKGMEEYEYTDEKGREVYGFELGNSTYYDGQRIIKTDEYNLLGGISIGYDYTYPYNEYPYNEDIYFSVQTDNGVQHYKMEMVSMSVYQGAELNRIAYEETKFAAALDYWNLYKNVFEMNVELYLLTE